MSSTAAGRRAALDSPATSVLTDFTRTPRPTPGACGARVGHVVATLLAVQRQHTLAVEGSGPDKSVRGIFSRLQIANDVGMASELPGRPATFAEIEEALVSR